MMVIVLNIQGVVIGVLLGIAIPLLCFALVLYWNTKLRLENEASDFMYTPDPPGDSTKKIDNCEYSGDCDKQCGKCMFGGASPFENTK